MPMTKEKIEEGMQKLNLKIKEVGPAIDIFDDSPAHQKFEVRRSLARASWTIRTIPGRQKVMILRASAIPVIGDSADPIRKKRGSN